MADLADHLETLIRDQGPLSIARFMAQALTHPEHGYYMRGDPFGAAGDFITAPEISQMFGELLGLWCASTWERMGGPDPVNVIELGPGRGTLMADALRAMRSVPGLKDAIRPHLIETSPVLKLRQQRALEGSGALWHEHLDEVPDAPSLVLANEFFDVLPMRQFERTERGWCERLVDLARDGDDGGGGARDFRFVLSARPTPSSALIPPSLRDSPLGSVAEVSPAGLALARDLGARMAAHGSAALIIDYGHEASTAGESLQAVRGHRSQPVLENPGDADITAHVDFEALGGAAREAGASIHGPITQGAFLEALGIEARAATLLENATPRQRIDIASALGRLTDPSRMGSLFKVMSISHPDLPPPVGFEGGS